MKPHTHISCHVSALSKKYLNSEGAIELFNQTAETFGPFENYSLDPDLENFDLDQFVALLCTCCNFWSSEDLCGVPISKIDIAILGLAATWLSCVASGQHEKAMIFRDNMIRVSGIASGKFWNVLIATPTNIAH